jgi:hypothetical protein
MQQTIANISTISSDALITPLRVMQMVSSIAAWETVRISLVSIPAQTVSSRRIHNLPLDRSSRCPIHPKSPPRVRVPIIRAQRCMPVQYVSFKFYLNLSFLSTHSPSHKAQCHYEHVLTMIPFFLNSRPPVSLSLTPRPRPEYPLYTPLPRILAPALRMPPHPLPLVPLMSTRLPMLDGSSDSSVPLERYSSNGKIETHLLNGDYMVSPHF